MVQQALLDTQTPVARARSTLLAAERMIPLGVDPSQLLRMLEDSIEGFRDASWERLHTEGRIAFSRALVRRGELLIQLAYTSEVPETMLREAMAAGAESREKFEELRRDGALENEEALGLPAAKTVVANAEARLAKFKDSSKSR